MVITALLLHALAQIDPYMKYCVILNASMVRKANYTNVSCLESSLRLVLETLSFVGNERTNSVIWQVL